MRLLPTGSRTPDPPVQAVIGITGGIPPCIRNTRKVSVFIIGQTDLCPVCKTHLLWPSVFCLFPIKEFRTVSAVVFCTGQMSLSVPCKFCQHLPVPRQAHQMVVCIIGGIHLVPHRIYGPGQVPTAVISMAGGISQGIPVQGQLSAAVIGICLLSVLMDGFRVLVPSVMAVDRPALVPLRQQYLPFLLIREFHRAPVRKGLLYGTVLTVVFRMDSYDPCRAQDFFQISAGIITVSGFRAIRSLHTDQLLPFIAIGDAPSRIILYPA